MQIDKPNKSPNSPKIDLSNIYRKNLSSTNPVLEESYDESDLEEEEEDINAGMKELKERRLIPLGKVINQGRPYFMRYPEVNDTTYNVFTFVSPMGGGKSVATNQLQITKEYGMLKMWEIYDKFHAKNSIHVLSFINKSKAVWAPVTAAMLSGEKETFEVIAEGGCRNKFSKDHIVLVWDNGIKNKRCHELTINDWVLFPKYIDYPEWEDKDKEEDARMCGIFIADGNSTNSQVQLSNNKYREFIIKYLNKKNIEYRDEYRNNCWNYKISARNNLKLFKGSIGIDQEYCISSNKRVPGWIFQNKAYMRAFIQGLMECDGTFTVGKQSKDRKGNQKTGKKHQIELMLKNREVINAVSIMLLGFGIRSCYATKMSRATNSNMDWQEYYRLSISGNDNLKKYLECIPPYTDFQKKRIKDWDIEATHNSNMRYNFDAWMDKLDPILKELKMAGNYWDYLKKKQKPADNHRFRELLAILDKNGYRDIADEVRWVMDNYYMAKIKSIEPSETRKCYDFEVRSTGNFLSGDGTGFFIHNSTTVRSVIYYTSKMDDTIQVIFDPMKMEFSKLAIKRDSDSKREHLPNSKLYDEKTNKYINLKVEPDSLGVFHLIPKFALSNNRWDETSQSYVQGYDKTTISIIEKDGGFIFAEDIAKLTEEQLFNSLNYRELRADQAVHYYLRAGMKVCQNKYGKTKWFVQDLIAILRTGVKKFREFEELGDIEDPDDMETREKGQPLSNSELQLIEKLEKYKEAGFFVQDEYERNKYTVDLRKVVRMGKVINISFLGYKKTEAIGEDFVVGQSDLILERLIEISNEYMGGVRKQEAGLPITQWERYLLKNWKVSLWFEESEIFVPRDCQNQHIKKWPCIKRLDYLMSFGRKYGFKNFGFITQRITKVNAIVFKESSHLFIGPIIGEERDQILSDFGVNKVKFKMNDRMGREQLVAVRDIVTTLSKDKHEWLFIDKGRKNIAAIRTYDSPPG